ncbi:MAG: PAS domain-containing protein, partial [Bacillota bacterium]
MDSFIFNNYFLTEIKSPDTFEIYFRLIVISLIMLFGFYAYISINNRKHIEEALRSSQRHREALFKALPVGVFYTDPDGLIVFANEMSCKIAGVPSEKMLGFNWVQYLHPEDKDKVFSEIMRCQENQQTFECEYRFLSSDGNVVWVSDRT